MKNISILSMLFASFLLLSSCSKLTVTVAGNSGEFDPVAYGYSGADARDIRLNAFNIPLIPVTVDDYATWLELDFGSGNDITLTTAMRKKIDYAVTSAQNTYWSDGRVRGTVENVVVNRLSVFGETRANQECVLADWKLYSTFPFDGLIGLRVFMDKRITVDYARKKLYVSGAGLPSANALPPGTTVIPLIEPPEYFPSGVFVPGRINGHDTVVYIDSGNSETAVNGKFFRTVPKEITLELGAQSYTLENYRVEPSLDFQDYARGIGIVLGSDFLRNCAITIDRAEGNGQLVLTKK